MNPSVATSRLMSRFRFLPKTTYDHRGSKPFEKIQYAGSPSLLLKRVFFRLQDRLSAAITAFYRVRQRLGAVAYPFGGNDPAAIGAGLGALDPLRVSPLRREATS